MKANPYPNRDKKNRDIVLYTQLGNQERGVTRES